MKEAKKEMIKIAIYFIYLLTLLKIRKKLKSYELV